MSTVLMERLWRVGVLTLNRPEQLNALNDTLMDALGAALLELDADDGIGAIVITGSDKAFAAGADIAAMGGGCELALSCAGGTQRLPRAIGKAKAMDMCLSARMLSAEEADRYGLVSRVVPNDVLMAETLKLATTIAGFSLPALIAIKESVNRAWESSLTEGVKFERHALYARFASDDAHEGMHAFLEKRKPTFQHC